MTSTYLDVYDGSRLLDPLADLIDLPIDLVNFLTAQLAALLIARLFRKSFRSSSPQFRHSLCLLLGLLMGYFCFGKQAIHLAALPMVSYIVIRTTKPQLMGNVVMAVSMIYLSCLHLHRQVYHSGEYSLDITGPMMVITERVTSLAYSIQDSLTGRTSKEHNIPEPLEFFSYNLAFQTLMCGPVVFYSDYIGFIRGSDDKAVKQAIRDGGSEPSPRRAVLLKVAGSLAAALLYLTLNGTYSLHRLAEQLESSPEKWSPLYTLWFAYAATLVVRCKYYHAWLLADAVCNNCGMGFGGYDDRGRAKWDGLSNIDVVGFELAQNFRSAIGSWNKNTNVWLRRVAYERGSAWRTARVYALSALWHGFYPGYYLTFLAGGVFTVAARKVRARVRPVFARARSSLVLYHALTFVSTRVAMTYATVPFVLLHLGPSLAFYGKLYYSLHFIALGAILIPSKSERSKQLPAEAPQSQLDSDKKSVEGDMKSVNGDAKAVNGEAKIQNGTNGKIKSQ